jgi:hypothetical protein
MSRTITFPILALLLALATTEAHGAGETRDASRSKNRALVGAGATWIADGYDAGVNPGVMFGFEFALGDHAAIGLNADFSMMKNSFGTETRSQIGADLKLLTASGTGFHPWLLLGAALASSSSDAEVGLGGGLGGYFGQSAGHSYFVDMRGYRMTSMEYDSYNQATLRFGVAF